MVQGVRWYLANALSLCNLEEMMAERCIDVDHQPLHRWVIRLIPLVDKAFRQHKRLVDHRWCKNETDIQSKYLYRGVDTTE